MWDFIDTTTLQSLFAWVFILTGSFFILTSGMGIIRMPDFYTRIHPAGLIDSMGAPLVLIGLIILEGLTLTSGKIFLLIIFLFITGPTATHAIAKSAFSAGLKSYKYNDKKKEGDE